MVRPALFVPIVLLTSSFAWASPFRAGLALVWHLGEPGGFSGMVQFEVPLERVAQPRPSVEPGPREGTPISPAPDERPDSNDPEDAPPPPVPRQQKPAPRFSSELARNVVREALRVRGEPGTKRRLDGLATRSRTASLLPVLTLRGARSTDQTLRLAPIGIDRYELTQTGGADLTFEARATWTLDKLIFADEELRIEHLRAGNTEAAERLALLVLKHLFTWQRARIRLASEELDPEASLDAELGMLEAETALDVLTDGFFGRVVARWPAPSLAARTPDQSQP